MELPIEVLIDLWLTGKSPFTARNYRYDLGLFRVWMGERPVLSATLIDLFAFRSSLEGHQPGYLARVLSALRSFWNFSMKLGLVQFNPAAAVPKPKLPDTLADRFLTEEQVERIIAKVNREENPRNYVILEVLYRTGVRVSELIRMRWSDFQVDPDGILRLSVVGKGGKVRRLEVSAKLQETLVWYQKQDREQPRDPADDRLFLVCTGVPMRAQQVRQIVNSASHKAGLHASPHWFRHAHTTHAKRRGCPDEVLIASLGHADGRTLARYNHLMPKTSSGAWLPD